MIPAEEHTAASFRALARARAGVQRHLSEWLCARAEVQRTRAAELRRLSAQQSRDWSGWRRLHRRVTGATISWPGLRRDRRAIVRVCMDCARVYAALPLAASEGEADAAWRTVPSWVGEQLRAGQLNVVPSHGICPGCARRRGWDE